MRRERRNSIIAALADVSSSEKSVMIAISGLIGDDSSIDLDWSDIEEVIDIDLGEAEEIMQNMYDLGVLEELDFENSIIG